VASRERTDEWLHAAPRADPGSYLLTAFLFIMGLKRMSSPVTARSGILWAGAGMLVATLAPSSTRA
jgi:H+-translocating NAD(P) transhydrogenase subunit beta